MPCSSDPERALRLYNKAITMAENLVSKDQIRQIQIPYWIAISRPLLSLGRTAEARRALSNALNALGEPEIYEDRLTMLDLQKLWARLIAKEGKRAEPKRTLDSAIQAGETLRTSHPSDLRPILFLSDLYRELAVITEGALRREALLRSASAWHSWPATSYTASQEHRDLAAAAR